MITVSLPNIDLIRVVPDLGWPPTKTKGLFLLYRSPLNSFGATFQMTLFTISPRKSTKILESWLGIDGLNPTSISRFFSGFIVHVCWKYVKNVLKSRWNSVLLVPRRPKRSSYCSVVVDCDRKNDQKQNMLQHIRISYFFHRPHFKIGVWFQ